MPFEVSCSECQGRLLVEQTGVVVECPHCGAHLEIPAVMEDPSTATRVAPDTQLSGTAAPSPASSSDAADPEYDSESVLDEDVSEDDLVHGDGSVVQAAPDPGAAAGPNVTESRTSDPVMDGTPANPSIQNALTPAVDASAPEPAGATVSGDRDPDGGEWRQVPAAQDEQAAAPVPAWSFPSAPEGTGDAGTVETDDHPVQGEMMPYLGELAEPAVGAESSRELEDAQGTTSHADDSGVDRTATPDEPSPGQFAGWAAAESTQAGQDEASGTDGAHAPWSGFGAVAQPVPEDTAVTESGEDAPAAETAAPYPAPADGAEPAGDLPGAAPAPSRTAQPAAASARQDMVPHSRFMLVVSYASAMTLVAVYLLWQYLTPDLSNLESLPDVRPPKKKDTIAYQLVPEGATMPAGHTLRLGETQKFGHIRVTPVRVTRGALQFEHHLGNEGVDPPVGPPVLKLWLKFENASSDQQIAPLDGLVFRRVEGADFDHQRSNNFLCRMSDKHGKGNRVLVWPLIETDVWNVRDQQASRELAPGETLETYIPTAADGLQAVLGGQEPLVWRVHIRKGYSPKLYGVTTVFEVEFSEDDVQPDPEESVPPDQTAVSA